MASLAYCHGKCGKRWEREPGEALYCSAECEVRAARERAANEAELLRLGFERDPVAVNAFIRGAVSLTAEEVYWDGLEVALAKVGIWRDSGGSADSGARGEPAGCAR